MVFGWIIPCVLTMSVAASIAEMTSAMPYVSHLTYPAIDLRIRMQNERRAVLLRSTTRSATLGTSSVLDHRLGERHRTGRPDVLLGLPNVRSCRIHIPQIHALTI